jgi:hypothetical protein
VNRWETNSSVERKERRKHICKKTGKCALCPPHGGENAGFGGTARRGEKKPRYKTARRKRNRPA